MEDEPSCSFIQDEKSYSQEEKSKENLEQTCSSESKSISQNYDFPLGDVCSLKVKEDEPFCSFTKDEKNFLLEEKNTENVSEPTSSSENKSITNYNDFSLPDMPEDYKATYDEYINKVKALASKRIIDSITPEHIKNFKHFNLRYYEDKYSVNFYEAEKCFNDMLIRVHSNKLFLISLASGNEIVRSNKSITEINFTINNNDRSNIKLGGKRKKGAKVIESHTILCQVKCEGIEKMFNIRAGVPGRILEINELVKTDPDLLRTDPKGDGFLAVVSPKGHPSEYEKVMSSLKLLSEDEYINYLTTRTSKFSELSKKMLSENNSEDVVT